MDVNDTHNARVTNYYDTHPINEDEILAKVAAKGANLDALTQDDLRDFDQDHYGGFDATDTLVSLADIRGEHAVLDVCSGLGGPRGGSPIGSAARSPESTSRKVGWTVRAGCPNVWAFRTWWSSFRAMRRRCHSRMPDSIA